jgi:hypothetical protein
LFAAAALAFAPLLATAESKVRAAPALPQYGQEVSLEINTQWLVYLPALRYSISGSVINVDYEYLVQDFGGRPDFSNEAPINLGELAPGNYTVRARYFDLGNNGSMTSEESTLAVVPPGSWGIYSLPAQPQAFTVNKVVIKSAAYFFPNTMRTTVTGNVVRVDFDYLSSANYASTSEAPAGAQAYGAISVPPLAPGVYTMEGWGRTNGGAYEKFFSTPVTVAPTTSVVEYYSPSLDHYFMSIGASEISVVDRGTQGDWKRTGGTFNAWTRQADAAAGAKPVCRFYARGPNSHFFTGNAQECEYLKGAEKQGRADAAASGRQFLGWAYEGIAFWALVPDANGACPSSTTPVKRYYNNRASQNDSNHRFTTDPTQQYAMTASSVEEGVAFCSAP